MNVDLSESRNERKIGKTLLARSKKGKKNGVVLPEKKGKRQLDAKRKAPP